MDSKFKLMMVIKGIALLGIVGLLLSCGGGGSGNTDNPNNTTTAPSMVESVRASPGDQSVTLTWADTPLADTYNIYWSDTIKAGNGGTLIENVNSGYVHSGLSNGAHYFYVVTAANSIGESEISAEDRATPSGSILISNLTFIDPNLQQCVNDAYSGPS